MKTLLNIYRTTFATLHQEWIHGVVNWLKYSPALWRPAIVPDSSLRICTPPAEVRTPYAGVHNSGLMNFRALGAASAFSSSLARINFISLARAGVAPPWRTPGGADEVVWYLGAIKRWLSVAQNGLNCNYVPATCPRALLGRNMLIVWAPGRVESRSPGGLPGLLVHWTGTTCFLPCTLTGHKFSWKQRNRTTGGDVSVIYDPAASAGLQSF